MLPQPKDVNPGGLNSELQVSPLHLNSHVSDVTTLLKTEFQSGPGTKKQSPQLYNIPTPIKKMIKQIKMLLEPGTVGGLKYHFRIW